MLSSLRTILVRGLRSLGRNVVLGSHFKLYAPQSPPAAPGQHLRIAVVSIISHLGDCIMLMPILDAIRREHPHAEVSVFVFGANNPLTQHPAVDHVYIHVRQRHWTRVFGSATDVYNLYLDWKQNYSHLRFDVCFVPRGGFDPFYSAHLAWMLGGRIRAGYSRQLEPEKLEDDLDEDPLFTHLVTTQRGLHEITRGIEALQLAGVLQQSLDTTQKVASLQPFAQAEAALGVLTAYPQLADPYAIIAPGASVPRRRWTPAGFAELAQTEMIDCDILPVFVGSPAERPLCEQIAASLSGPSLIITGTTFVELACLCARAEFFLGNDSGPGHVAGALGIPTLEATAFAQSGDPRHHASPARSHPCGPFVTVVQPARQLAPCIDECIAEEEHCIAQVTPAEMQMELRKLLQRRKGLQAELPMSRTE